MRRLLFAAQKRGGQSAAGGSAAVEGGSPLPARGRRAAGASIPRYTTIIRNAIMRKMQYICRDEAGVDTILILMRKMH